MFKIFSQNVRKWKLLTLMTNMTYILLLLLLWLSQILQSQSHIWPWKLHHGNWILENGVWYGTIKSAICGVLFFCRQIVCTPASCLGIIVTEFFWEFTRWRLQAFFLWSLGVLVLCRQVVYRRHVYMSWYPVCHQILLRTYKVMFASVLLVVSSSCLGIIVTNSSEI